MTAVAAPASGVFIMHAVIDLIEIVMFVARHISSLLVSAIVVNNDKVAIEDASLFVPIHLQGF